MSVVAPLLIYQIAQVFTKGSGQWQTITAVRGASEHLCLQRFGKPLILVVTKGGAGYRCPDCGLHNRLNNPVRRNKMLSRNALSLSGIRTSLIALTGLLLPLGASADYTLTVLHTNDFHSRFEPISKYNSGCKPEDNDEGKCFGGAARLVSAVQDARARTNNSILVDGGDQFQGSLFYTCLLYTSPSPRDQRGSRMPSSA